jgi:hypothetical protein
MSIVSKNRQKKKVVFAQGRSFHKNLGFCIDLSADFYQ